MNSVEFAKLNSQLTSLRMSTTLTLTTRTASVVLSGRCSPYRSHQGVEFGLGIEELPVGTLLVENAKFRIAIGDHQATERKAQQYVPDTRGGRGPAIVGRALPAPQRNRINDDPNAETEAQLMRRYVAEYYSRSGSEFEQVTKVVTVPTQMVDAWTLIAQDEYEILSTRSVLPLCTVIFALAQVSGYEADAEGVMRPVFVRRNLDQVAEDEEARRQRMRDATVASAQRGSYGCATRQQFAERDFEDLRFRLVSAGLVAAALKPSGGGCVEGIERFCRERGIDPLVSHRFDSLDWSNYEGERDLIADYLRAHPEKGAPVEDEYSRADMSE